MSKCIENCFWPKKSIKFPCFISYHQAPNRENIIKIIQHNALILKKDETTDFFSNKMIFNRKRVWNIHVSYHTYSEHTNFYKKNVFGPKWAWNILISRYITIKGQRELKLNMTPKPNNLMVWPVHSAKRMNTLFFPVTCLSRRD